MGICKLSQNATAELGEQELQPPLMEGLLRVGP